ncbi:MAG: hypothetical protein ACK4ZS_06415 [Sulfurimicrobium sp.]
MSELDSIIVTSENDMTLPILEEIVKPLWIAATLCLSVAACGEEKKPYRAPLPKTPAAPLFQGERQGLDKARGVEKTLDAHAREEARKSEQP